MLFSGDYPSAAFIRSNSSNRFRRRFSMSEGSMFKTSYDGLANGCPLSFRDIPCPSWDFLFDPCFGQEAGPKNEIIGTGFTSGGRSGRGGT